MNPVYKNEVRYQQYVIRTNRSANLWIALAVVMLIPALITAVGVFITVGLLGLDIPPIPLFGEIDTFSEGLYTLGVVALLTMNLAHYLVVALITSGLAIFSVQREQRNRTWELLVLTRVTARQIVTGKLLASLWVLRRDLMIVTMLRVGLVVLALDFVRELDPAASFTAGHVLILTGMVVMWTVLDTAQAITAAMASALVPQIRSALMPTALLVRAITLLGGVWWIGTVVNALYSTPGSAQYLINGVTGLVVFSALTLLSLKFAEISAQFANASRHKISQIISQTSPPPQGHEMSNIPNLSQG